MSKRYCHECGKEMEAHFKFCAACGTNLNSLAATKPVTQTTPPPAWAESDDDDDGYLDNDSFAHKIKHLKRSLGNLQVEISGPLKVQGEKLGSFAATSDLDRSNFRQGNAINLTPEQVAADFAKEAGSRVGGTKVHSIDVDD